MKNSFLILRWSWRDLRKYWVKVIAIALVIGIGTGAYAGLTSTANWRRDSNVASVELLNMYDVRFELATDSSVPEGTLTAAAAGIDHFEWIEDSVERVIRPTQVDASTTADTVLVPGEIVGVDISAGGPVVNGWHLAGGETLQPDDTGQPVVLLEHGFVFHNDLPATGVVTVSGGEELQYVGNAMTPEFFIVVPENTTSFAQGTYAGVFTSMETAQGLTGMDGSVNDLILTVTEDADRDVVATEVKAAITDLGVGVNIIMKEDDPS